jgi:hypothetical protein
MKGSQESLTTVVVKDAANWRTLSASDGEGGIKAGPKYESADQPKIKLRDHVHWQVAQYGQAAPANPSTDGSRLESWATPRANKVHPEITEDNRDHLANRNKSNLEEEIAGHCGKATGKLNPRWVEALMGLPIGWTMPSCTRPVTIEPMNCDCLETESSLQPLNSPSELF